MYTHALTSCHLLQFFTWLYHLTYLGLEHYPSDYLCDEMLILVILNILDFPGDTVQGTWVWSLVQEDPTYHRAAKLMYKSCWAHGLEPVSHSYWALMPQLLKPTHPRAHTLQLEKACAQQQRPDTTKIKSVN